MSDGIRGKSRRGKHEQALTLRGGRGRHEQTRAEREREDRRRRGGRRGRIRVFPMVLLLLALGLGTILIESNAVLTSAEYELRYADLPEGFDGYRILMLSDIHAAVFGKDNGRLIAKARAAKPDIIAITGDLIDGSGSPPAGEQLQIARSLATSLLQIAPVYYITGNHDWNSGELKTLIAIFGEIGVTVLRNNYVVLESGGGSLILAGTDDPNGPADMIRPEELAERIFLANEDAFVVMLEHRNNNLRLYSELGIRLVLSGHAHGGVIRLPFTDGLIGPQRDWFPTYTSGVYSMGGTDMVVSRGIGNHTGFPRFLNNPQIVVAVLRREA